MSWLFGISIFLYISYSSSDAVESPISVCDQPVAFGTCKLNISRWYYDKNINSCFHFIFKGCEGNGNRFLSERQCLQRCRKKFKSHTVIPDELYELPPEKNLTCNNCHLINGTCIGRRCVCPAGFQLVDFKCVDVDECKLIKCEKHSSCKNSLGSFRCECDIGFAGSGLNCSNSPTVCGQLFDERYEESCHNINPEFQQRYFYNSITGRCQTFLYGGCQFASSQNVFHDLHTCETLCGEYSTPPPTTPFDNDNEPYTTTRANIPDPCMEPFDPNRKEQCEEADWKLRYYYDKDTELCESFWFDVSCSNVQFTSKNIFVHKQTCEKLCGHVSKNNGYSNFTAISGIIQASPNKYWRIKPPVNKPLSATTPIPEVTINLFEGFDDLPTRPTSKQTSRFETPTTYKWPDTSEKPPLTTTPTWYHIWEPKDMSSPVESESQTAKKEMPTTVWKIKVGLEHKTAAPKTSYQTETTSQHMSKTTQYPGNYNKDSKPSLISSTTAPSETITTNSYSTGTNKIFYSKTTAPDIEYLVPTFSSLDDSDFQPDFDNTGIKYSNVDYDTRGFDGKKNHGIIQHEDKIESKHPSSKIFTVFPSNMDYSVEANNIGQHSELSKEQYNFGKFGGTRKPNLPSLKNDFEKIDLLPTRHPKPYVHPTGTLSPDLKHSTTTFPNINDKIVEKLRSEFSTTAISKGEENKIGQTDRPMIYNVPVHEELDSSKTNFEKADLPGSVIPTDQTSMHGKTHAPETVFEKHTPHKHIDKEHPLPTTFKIFSKNENNAKTEYNAFRTTEASVPHRPDIRISGGQISVEGNYDVKDSTKTQPLEVHHPKGHRPTNDLSTKHVSFDVESTTPIPSVHISGNRHSTEFFGTPKSTPATEIKSSSMPTPCSTRDSSTWHSITKKPRKGKIRHDKKPPLDENSKQRNYNDSSSYFIDDKHISPYEKQSLLAAKKKHGAVITKAQNYSLVYKKTVSISTMCLEPFDNRLALSCKDESDWSKRYFFDAELNACRMYWYGGCWSPSKNNFETMSDCQWHCEPTESTKETRYCFDKFDAVYKKDCRSGTFEVRYYFDHATKQCSSFYFGGCQSASKNIFSDLGECQNYCERVQPSTYKFCLEPFDTVYKESCTTDNIFAQYYYFDATADSCKMFWYGNCKSTSQNIFATLESCQWLCQRKKDQVVPNQCLDKFDKKYTKSCNGGRWQKMYYFDHLNGLCTKFFYDGCIAESQNIFKTRELCVSLCEAPSVATTPFPTGSNEISPPEVETDSRRCLEPLLVGNCRDTLPAYHYNQKTKRCEPFSYTGCQGNGNRFLTLSQCENVCLKYSHLEQEETACFLTPSIGYGRNDNKCIRHAGYYYYYNHAEARCGRFWFLGCGGNNNRFKTLIECQQICRRTHYLKTEVIPKSEPVPVVGCFERIDVGNCEKSKTKSKIRRWGYDAGSKKCKQFEYTGCGGNFNRFGTEHECMKLCYGLVTPNSLQCAHFPDWGTCNQLHYMWFYNMTKGTCDQFLYGGCGGNTNRFSTFEICQVTCEVPGNNMCDERLDRGKWCESMSNRYYYHKKSNTCKGFHYTGCGKSRNNFVELSECERQCVNRQKTAVVAPGAKLSKAGYAGVKPKEHPAMIRHQILDQSDRKYLKSRGQWVPYGHCMGFRYNITGPHTRVKSFICNVESGGLCVVETLLNTFGEEYCRVVRPWLRDTHYYTWFFTVEKTKGHVNLSFPNGNVDHFKNNSAKRFALNRNDVNQTIDNTAAAIMILPINDCFSIC